MAQLFCFDHRQVSDVGLSLLSLTKNKPIPVTFSHKLYAQSKVSLHSLVKLDFQLVTDFCPQDKINSSKTLQLVIGRL